MPAPRQRFVRDPHLLRRVVAHPNRLDLPRLDRIGHQLHQARDVDTTRGEVVLVQVDATSAARCSPRGPSACPRRSLGSPRGTWSR